MDLWLAWNFLLEIPDLGTFKKMSYVSKIKEILEKICFNEFETGFLIWKISFILAECNETSIFSDGVSSAINLCKGFSHKIFHFIENAIILKSNNKEIHPQSIENFKNLIKSNTYTDLSTLLVVFFYINFF